MAGKVERCPNKKCPYKDGEENPEHRAFERKYIEKSDHLCSHCESRLVEQ